MKNFEGRFSVDDARTQEQKIATEEVNAIVEALLLQQMEAIEKLEAGVHDLQLSDRFDTGVLEAGRSDLGRAEMITGESGPVAIKKLQLMQEIAGLKNQSLSFYDKFRKLAMDIKACQHDSND